jgi:hypothetical protein
MGRVLLNAPCTVFRVLEIPVDSDSHSCTNVKPKCWGHNAPQSKWVPASTAPEQGVKFCRDFRLSGLVPAVSGQVSSIKMFQKPKEFARHFKWQSLNRHLPVRVLPA